MVLDRFILQEALKKGYHVGIFGGHIFILWYVLPAEDALLYTGYTLIAYTLYGVMMIALYASGQFGNDYAIPVRKQLACFFPLLNIVIED